ncbi:MAG: UDP-N-acetylmuramoyl-L-alanyl-D-glutamate--2,6-diaminopimelate ligase [Bacteroidota bacterium]
MKRLTDLLTGIAVEEIRGEKEREIRELNFDSRKGEEDSLFIAIRGTMADGHRFIDKTKAKTIVCEALPDNLKEDVTYIRVANSRKVLSELSANFFDRPADQLKVIGVTGTNGKTSVATLLYKALNNLGHKTGLVSTIDYRIGEKVIPSTHTTPDPIRLHQMFLQMLDEGCEYVCMEVSSHALSQDRTASIPFQAAIFTNITHDHLDYHGTFANYIAAKKMLFDQLPKGALALVNLDDRNGKVMVQNTAGRVRSFALRGMADYRSRIIENSLTGLHLEIDRRPVWMQLLGDFNAYNLLAVYATLVEEGFGKDEVLAELSKLKGIDGRFEIVPHPENKLIGIVDYSHTPDSLEKALKTIKTMANKGEEILVVVGCGGDRDKEKRPKMAKIAASYADRAILTSDNPRSEEPEAILEDMWAGVQPAERKKTLRIVNRKEAIRTAVQMAADRSVILVAGKGHETYQEIKGVRHPFDDKKILREVFAE